MHARLTATAFAVALLAGCSGSDSGRLQARYPAAATRIFAGPGFARSERGFVRSVKSEPGRPVDPVRAAEAALARRGAIGLRLPERAGDPATFTLPGGLAVTVRERGLSGAAQVEGAALVYAGSGGRSYWSATDDGFEEWIEVASATDAPVAEWDVEGAALRQVGDRVELLDAQGTARAQVTAPTAFEAGGAERRAWLRVSGSRLALFTDARGAAIVDPAWSAVGSMSTGRREHTATLLPSGKVLVAGGLGTGGALASSELFDPATGTWSRTGSLAAGRYQHTATLLESGKVLVAGGVRRHADAGESGERGAL